MEKNCVEETANALTVKQDVYVKNIATYITQPQRVLEHNRDLTAVVWAICTGNLQIFLHQVAWFGCNMRLYALMSRSG